MKNVIFYFSGTGNTYWAAKTTAQLIGNCKLINIAKFDCSQKIKAERVGIFFPVYFWGLPNILKRFASNVNIESGFVFELHTMGGYEGVSVKQLEKYLSEKNIKLSSSYHIKMPNNLAQISRYNVLSDVCRIPDDAKIISLISKAKKKLKVFSRQIRNKQPHKNTDLFFVLHKYGYYLNEHQSAGFAGKGAAFEAALENTCTGCGKCSRVCPVSNITIVSGRPVWGNNCEFCSACLNNCPVKAINYGYSKGKRRYVFPHCRKKL
ncbi:MAG: EFR1 family ferrodoxin [Oscillospiraceae bacterium]|nr:EFR1 family ferrodoxin [Oscillospiraceae bacterium]